jgi:hypothetical protein
LHYPLHKSEVSELSPKWADEVMRKIEVGLCSLEVQ